MRSHVRLAARPSLKPDDVVDDPRERPAAVPLPAAPDGGPAPLGPPRLTLRLDDVAQSLGVSRRAIERERAAGRFPAPDLHIGRMPLWTPETLRRWIERGGR